MCLLPAKLCCRTKQFIHLFAPVALGTPHYITVCGHYLAILAGGAGGLYNVGGLSGDSGRSSGFAPRARVFTRSLDSRSALPPAASAAIWPAVTAEGRAGEGAARLEEAGRGGQRLGPAPVPGPASVCDRWYSGGRSTV